MLKSTYFYQTAPVFHGRKLPEEGGIVGYSSIINTLQLKVPMPDRIALVCKQNKKYQNEEWNIFPNSYLPEDNKNISELEALYKHLVFALKYEGVNLLFFIHLTKYYKIKQLTKLVSIEPTGQYSRRIWFIIEWLLQKPLPEKQDLTKKSYVPLLDENLQYVVEGVKSSRHLSSTTCLALLIFARSFSKPKNLKIILR